MVPIGQYIIYLIRMVPIRLILRTRTHKEGKDGDLLMSYRTRLRTILYTHRNHGEATATVTVSTEREGEGAVVLVSFVWFSLDNTLFIAAPDIQY